MPQRLNALLSSETRNFGRLSPVAVNGGQTEGNSQNAVLLVCAELQLGT